MSFIEKEDVVFEEDILRNPYSVKHWLRYVEHKSHREPKVRFNIYERAVKQMPGSYKLWYRYLVDRRAYASNFPPNHHARSSLRDTYTRALVYMHKMPRIWIEYLEVMIESGQVTETRRAFDACLQALAITQHHRIWPAYLEFVRDINVPETAVRVYRRYLLVEPQDAEEYIDYLVSIDRFDEAATKLGEIVSDHKYQSKRGKSNHQLWLDLCELIKAHPGDITTLRIDKIIRAGLKRFTDMTGDLWCALANYHIRCANFEKARDVFEEGIQTVKTVRDFSTIFEAYSEFEESTLNAMIEASEQEEDVELDLRLARYDNLTERRPLLLSSVLLRQNPHNVDEWLKRAMLYEGRPKDMLRTFTEAVATVDHRQAVGKMHQLWVEFGKLYEKMGMLPQARGVFEKAVESDFKAIDDLATVWCEYAEMEIRNKQYKRALALLRRATVVPPRSNNASDNGEQSVTGAQRRVHRSLKLWSMYVDLEESLGTFETTKAVYSRMLDLRIATVQVVLNFCSFLEEHSYFDEAFSAYERGLALFQWPTNFEIWNAYLTKFIERYGSRKIERVRELFEQCVENMPEKFAKTVYLKYAQYEEEHGLARHAMAVYRRAVRAVPAKQRFEMWQTYIKRCAFIFGVKSTRDLYAEALEDESLSDREMSEMAMQFATLEVNLGEVDRARAIYAHASQVCDPRTSKRYWKAWDDFETSNGNDDTVREMLRIKHSVAAQFNTASNMSMLKAVQSQTREVTSKTTQSDPMAEAEAEAKKGSSISFVKASGSEQSQSTTGTNAAEISLDDDDDDSDSGSDEEGDSTATGGVTERSVPEGVLGALARFEGKK